MVDCLLGIPKETPKEKMLGLKGKVMRRVKMLATLMAPLLTAIETGL